MILMDDVFYKIIHTTPAEHYVAVYTDKGEIGTCSLVLWATIQAAFYREAHKHLHFRPVKEDVEEDNESRVVGLIISEGRLSCPEEDINFLGYCLATDNAKEIYGERAKEYDAEQEAKRTAQTKKDAR